MKKALGSILFVLYAIIAITVTVLLLSYNDYNNSELGGYTVYIVKDDSLEPEYKQGSILLIKKTNDRNVKSGDEVILLGKTDNIKFDADDLAKCCDSINYEVLCLLKKRVPRVYIKDGKIFDVKNNV